jgi:hypothetical protein
VLKTALLSGQPIDFAEVQTHLRGEAEITLLSELTLSDEIDDRTLQRLDENLRPMERSWLDRRKQQIQREILDAEKSGAAELVNQLVTEKMELSRMSSALK